MVETDWSHPEAMQDRNDDCHIAISWAPEGKRRRGRPKTNLETNRRKETERDKVKLMGGDEKDRSTPRI